MCWNDLLIYDNIYCLVKTIYSIERYVKQNLSLLSFLFTIRFYVRGCIIFLIYFTPEIVYLMSIGLHPIKQIVL